MNIFVLGYSPKEAAMYHCDKHRNKMQLEGAQLLSSAINLATRILPDGIYKATHINHPCSKWVRSSRQNYLWLRNLILWLGYEAWKDSGNVHTSCRKAMSWPVPDLPDIGLTEFAQAMPEQFRCEDPVQAYRNCYMYHKPHLLYWKNRRVPDWVDDPEIRQIALSRMKPQSPGYVARSQLSLKDFIYENRIHFSCNESLPISI